MFDRIYRIVCHQEAAEDRTQETFVKMFRALERNGPERPDSTRSHLAMTR